MPAVRPRRGKIVLAALMAGFAGFAGPATAADTFVVAVDQARLMRVPDRTATIIVGNPLIADVSLQSGGMLVVTGKGAQGFGILDRKLDWESGNHAPWVDFQMFMQDMHADFFGFLNKTAKA